MRVGALLHPKGGQTLADAGRSAAALAAGRPWSGDVFAPAANYPCNARDGTAPGSMTGQDSLQGSVGCGANAAALPAGILAINTVPQDHPGIPVRHVPVRDRVLSGTLSSRSPLLGCPIRPDPGGPAPSRYAAP